MRRSPILAAAFAAVAPLPAFAADASPEEQDLARAAEEMRDPARQEQIAQVAEAAMGAMLQVPVGKLLQAAATIAGEDAADIDPDTTLAEVAGPDAEDAPREFARAMPRMMEAMGVLTGALGSMLPELRRAGEQIAHNLPDDPAD